MLVKHHRSILSVNVERFNNSRLKPVKLSVPKNASEKREEKQRSAPNRGHARLKLLSRIHHREN